LTYHAASQSTVISKDGVSFHKTEGSPIVGTLSPTPQPNHTTKVVAYIPFYTLVVIVAEWVSILTDQQGDQWAEQGNITFGQGNTLYFQRCSFMSPPTSSLSLSLMSLSQCQI